MYAKTVIIPAGGSASRMFYAPKFLIPAPCNKPVVPGQSTLLGNLLEAVSECMPDAKVVIVTNPLNKPFIELFEKGQTSASVSVLVEETATPIDAIIKGIDFSTQIHPNSKDFLYTLVFPDTYMTVLPDFFPVRMALKKGRNWKKLGEVYEVPEAEVVVSCWKVPAAYATHLGVVNLDHAGKIVNVVDKPNLADLDRPTYWVWGSISWTDTVNYVWAQGLSSMTDFINLSIAKGHNVQAYPYAGAYFDVGTPAGLAAYSIYLMYDQYSSEDATFDVLAPESVLNYLRGQGNGTSGSI